MQARDPFPCVPIPCILNSGRAEAARRGDPASARGPPSARRRRRRVRSGPGSQIGFASRDNYSPPTRLASFRPSRSAGGECARACVCPARTILGKIHRRGVKVLAETVKSSSPPAEKRGGLRSPWAASARPLLPLPTGLSRPFSRPRPPRCSLLLVVF